MTGRKQRSHVILQPVVTKRRGRRKARKGTPAAAVSGRGWQRKRDDDGGDSADEVVTGEVGADALVTGSRMKAEPLGTHRGAESQNNPAEAEKEGEVVGAAIDMKLKQKTQENDEAIPPNAQAGNSHRITRSSSLSGAAVLLSPVVKKKRGRRKVGDGKDDLGAEEQAAEVQDLTTAASPVIVECKRRRTKGKDCVPSVQKPCKVVVSCRNTRSGSVAATVMLPIVIGNKRKKTSGRPKARKALPAAAVSRRGRWQKRDVGGDSVDQGAAGEVGADALVTQARTKAMNLLADSVVESQNNPAEAEEEGKVVGAAINKKWKRETQENAEDIASNAQAGVSHRSTRKSNLSVAAVLLSAVVEKQEGRRKVGDVKDEIVVKEQAAGVEDLATAAAPVIVESKRSRRKAEDCIPVMQKPANMEVSGRTTRSHSVAAVVMLPAIAGHTRSRKTEDAHPDGELPTLSEVPRNDAPVTKSLRNRVVQINNCLVEKTLVGKKLEKKRQPGRPATRRHQPLASSVEEEEQVAAPCKLSPLRRSSRNHPEADELSSNAHSETKELSTALAGAKDSKIAQPLTRNTANTNVVMA